MERFDVFVIGGGGTGSEVAFQLAQRSDLRVAIAERDKLGGECSHYGCVPTKVMLRSAKIARLARDASRFGVRVPSVEIDLPAIQRRAQEVIDAGSGEGARPFEDAGIAVFLQQARLVGDRRIELEDGTQLEADRVVFATGTETAVPSIAGLADGPYWTNREAIWGPDAPPSSLAVIGTGAIGIEFAQIYARFGASVTAIEALPQILPDEDEDAAAALVPALEEEGIRLLPGSTIERAEHDGRGWTISLADGTTLQTEALLVAAGRRPVFDGHDLDAVGHGARRSRPAGALRDAAHHGPERVGGGRRDRRAPVHARRVVRGRARDRRHPRHAACARLPRGPARDVLRPGGRERRADRAGRPRRRPRGPHRDRRSSATTSDRPSTGARSGW